MSEEDVKTQKIGGGTAGGNMNGVEVEKKMQK